MRLKTSLIIAIKVLILLVKFIVLILLLAFIIKSGK
jgi:hypothetical protein